MSCLWRIALGFGWFLAVAFAPSVVHADEAKESQGSPRNSSNEREGGLVSVSGTTDPETENRPPLVVVGPLLATVWRPSNSDVVSYGPGVGVGAFLMIPLTSWLLTRASFRQEFLSVSAPQGAIGIEGSPRPLDLSQPGLTGLAFSAEVEGVYRPFPRVSLRGGFGIAWARLVAPPPEAKGFYVDSERALAVSTLSLSLGAAYSLIPSWLELGFRVSGGLPFAQNGTFLVPLQVIVDGKIAHVDPLPATAALFDATLELGLVF